MNRLTTTALALALALPMACSTPTADDWAPSTELAADWLANNGLELYGPMPKVAVIPHDDLQDNVPSKEARDWLDGREVQAIAFGPLRVVHLSDRLDPERDRSVIVRELAGIICFDRGWCQDMTQDEREAWIASIQARFEQDRP